MFLVLLRCHGDDLPLHVSGSLEGAKAFAKRASRQDVQRICDLLRIDANEEICMDIIGFDADGDPETHETFRSFDGTEDELSELRL